MTRRQAQALAATVLASVATATFVVFRDLRHDDAYITFQYARNLASGHGFVFNPGERVLGTTTPLDTILLALVGVFSGAAIPTAAIAISCAALAAEAALLYRLAAPASRLVGVALAAMALAGFGHSHTWLALETNLFTALVLATLVGLSEQRPIGTGVALGFAFLCRYDAGLLLPLVAVTEYARRRRVPTKTFGAFLVVVLPWLAWATLYFGSFLPHSLSAKRSLWPPDEYLAYHWDFLRDSASTALPRGLAEHARVLAPLAWCVGLAWIARHGRRLLFFVGFAVALLCAYAAIGPPAPQHWHVHAVDVATGVLLVAGIGWLPVLAARFRLPALAGSTLAIGLAALLVACTVSGTYGFSRSYRTDVWLGGRDARFHTVAAWLANHVKPHQVFLASEVGTLGWLTDHRMIDPTGILNEAGEFPRRPTVGNFLALLAVYRPDILLVDSPELGRKIESRTPYRVIHVFEWVRPSSTLLVRDPGVLSGVATAAPR